ncbi:SDR family NAD(P)-dependent oxidoreductase [Variovorax terrae]|uniref:SDR family oxidoreductase n=1 Tax=Variovorax terrae TaxID=2923278 RepID=A0A9X2AP87_9BURK|nr:SDR family oxidoreductase [Variovorax terrae]MCJ0765558.1 SDR family oxidoreductase [Variovorax terrae]
MTTTHPLFDLAGQVALVTGASRGIGLASARALAQAGAQVVLCSHEAAECEAAAGALRAEGLDAQVVVADLVQRPQVDALVAQVLASHGRIDTLVCNAGAAPHMGPIATASDADWELTMTLNLRSVLWLTSAVIAHMAERRSGSVMLMSSIAGLRGNKGLGLYGLSKAALAGLARNLAVEWGPSGVRVNAVSPGVTRTEFARPLTDQPEVMQRRIALTPLRRIAEPEEIAGAVLFLASAAGGFTTGHNLVVDGGTTISDGN